MNVKQAARTALVIIGSGWGLSESPLAISAEGDPASARAIEEIVVTARRREEDLQTTPVSVAVFSAEALDAKAISNLGDVSNFVPNVTIAPDFTVGTGASSVFIRGVGQTDYRMFSDPGVAMYVDGVFIPRSLGGLMDLLDLERIEVLRGPQGTLYGKNTVAGAINLVSARPVQDANGAVELSAGAYSRYDAKGILNVPLAEGLAIRASGLVRSFEGWGNVVNNVDLNGNDTRASHRPDEDLQAGRIQALWQATPDFEALLSLDGSRSRSGGPVRRAFGTDSRGLGGFYNQQVIANDLPFTLYGPALIQADPYAKTANFPEAVDLDVFGASLTLDWNLGRTTLRSITSYRELEGFINIDADSTYAQIWEQSEFNEQDQFGQEFQLSGLALADRLHWVAGVFYFEESGSRNLTTQQLRQLVDLGLYPASLTQQTNATIDSDSYAVYGQASFSITEPLSVTAGLRWTEENKSIDLNRINAFGIDPVVGITGQNSGSWNDVSPRLGVEYQWNPEIMTFASVARGFKSGGFNGRPSPLLPNNGLIPYDPETLTTYELGVRSDWLNNRLRLNATAFFSDYEDIQTTSTQIISGQTTIVVGNAAAAEMKGLELELIAALSDRWRLDANAGYIDAKYTDISGAATLYLNNVSGTGVPVPPGSDSVFPLTPEYSFNIGNQYSIDLPSNRGILTLRFDVSYQDEMSPDTNPDRADGVAGALLPQSELLESRTLVNARVAFSSPVGRYTVAAYVTNLTDELYRATAVDFNAGFGFEQYGPPRQWGLSIRAEF
jgi:iron complex outermembrane recepter protein